MTDDFQSSRARPVRRRFTQLVDALERVDARYAICGAVAMAAHGAVRNTEDIDVLVAQTDLENVVRELSRSMKEIGREPDDGPAKQVRLRSRRANGPAGVDIDLMVPVDAVESWALATAVRGRAFARKVDLASAEALVVMKLRAYLSDPESGTGWKHRSDADKLIREASVDIDELRGFVGSTADIAAELERVISAPAPRGRIR